MAPRILAFSGSARRDSLNKKLVRVAAQAARDAGGEVTLVDLDHYPMPVYHGDLEDAEGMPENARKLRELFVSHDALLISTPENNASMSALLKNTLDWLSRSIGDGKGPNSGLAPYRGKVAAILGATPGPWGTLRGGLPHLRQVLSILGVLVIPTQLPLAHADNAFLEDGTLADPKQAKTLQAVAKSLVETTAKLRA
jgi:chromate reductase, NAD(P)H dehydrogenase (quinone)